MDKVKALNLIMKDIFGFGNKDVVEDEGVKYRLITNNEWELHSGAEKKIVKKINKLASKNEIGFVEMVQDNRVMGYALPAIVKNKFTMLYEPSSGSLGAMNLISMIRAKDTHKELEEKQVSLKAVGSI